MAPQPGIRAFPYACAGSALSAPCNMIETGLNGRGGGACEPSRSCCQWRSSRYRATSRPGTRGPYRCPWCRRTRRCRCPPCPRWSRYPFQWRLWLTQPALDEAPRVRVSDRGVDQRNPSGTASASRGTGPDVRVQSNLRAVATGKPGRPRPSMYVIREYAAHHSTDPRPLIRTRSARGSRQKAIRANRRPGAQRT